MTCSGLDQSDSGHPNLAFPPPTCTVVLSPEQRRWADIFTTTQVQQGFLVILTDGSDTQGSYTLSEALTARGNKNVYTIGLGNEIDPDVLRELGNAGFFQIADVSKLADQLVETVYRDSKKDRLFRGQLLLVEIPESQAGRQGAYAGVEREGQPDRLHDQVDVQQQKFSFGAAGGVRQPVVIQSRGDQGTEDRRGRYGAP